MKKMSLYLSNMLRIVLSFLPLYCVARFVWVAVRKDACRPVRELVLAAFTLFMLGLLALTLQDGQELLSVKSFAHAWRRLEYGIGVNLVPFRTIRSYLKYMSNPDIIRVNIVGNIVMFIPWGLGLPLLWKRFRSPWKVGVLALLLPMLIEFCQLFVGRSVDVDDILLNFLGAALGGTLYALLWKCFPKVERLAR